PLLPRTQPPPPPTLFPYTTLFRSPDLPARTAIKAFGRDPSQPLVAKHPEDRRAAAGQHGCLRSAHEQQFPDLAQHGILPFHHGRSEEHTSELQSRVDLVCRLLLEK